MPSPDELAFDLDGTRRHLESALSALAASVAREKRLRADLIQLHALLAERDQEVMNWRVFRRPFGEIPGTPARRLKVWLRYTWAGEHYVNARERLLAWLKR